MTPEEFVTIQKEVCQKYGAEYAPVAWDQTAGVARNLVATTEHVNGLRHPPVDQTCGWHIWAGELSPDPDFFQPLHVAHFIQQAPHILKYLALGPGWRFLIAEGHEDVWFYATLLDVSS